MRHGVRVVCATCAKAGLVHRAAISNARFTLCPRFFYDHKTAFNEADILGQMSAGLRYEVAVFLSKDIFQSTYVGFTLPAIRCVPHWELLRLLGFRAVPASDRSDHATDNL